MQPLLLPRERPLAAVWTNALQVRADAPVDFAVAWKSPWREFGSSVVAFFTGPRPEKESLMPLRRPLRVQWIRGRIPGRSMLASVAWHVAIIWLLILPIWGFLPPIQSTLAPVQIELTWYGPTKDLPPISLPAGAAKARPAAKNAETPKPADQSAADAFHPRQTILSLPLHITHPRQTLIQPSAPAEPPKIAPPLPNIVQWPAQELAKPKLQYSTAASAARVKQRAIQDVAAPEIANTEKLAGPINIASPAAVKLSPQMPINAMSARATTRKPAPADVPAPDVASPGEGDASLQRIIALSAAPAPPSPNLVVPQGNLAARISVSPDGGKSGASGGAAGSSSASANAAETGSAGNASAGAGANESSLPATIMVGPPRAPVANGGGTASSGNGTGNSNGRGLNNGLNGLTSGLGSGLNNGSAGNESATRHAPGVAWSPAAQPPSGARMESPRARTIDPAMPPEKILSGKEVYTLHVNLPNLTSASGSWILNFAQLDEDDGPPFHPRTQLSGPEVLNTVDPKYPQALIAEHVRGQVVLYAIIRKDGSVDSIQIVQGLDPQLDRNAMQALAQWKFRPGKRAGAPIDLEAVVYIPFNYQSPLDYQSPLQ